jgi:hypothetical protein
MITMTRTALMQKRGGLPIVGLLYAGAIIIKAIGGACASSNGCNGPKRGTPKKPKKGCTVRGQNC